MTDDAKQAIRQAIAGADRPFRVLDGGKGKSGGEQPQGGEPDCPVHALGHMDGVFHFIDVRGQKRALTARQLGSRQDLLSLFGGDDAWLREQHPFRKQDRDTGEWKVLGFSVNDAAADLQRRCFKAGLFGGRVVLRQPGIWRAADGSPVVHCGDGILIDGDWKAPGFRNGEQLWAAAEPVPRPDTPCPAAIAARIQQDLQTYWTWREPGGPVATLGLIANGYYGAATRWRPAGFVIGPTGSGKTGVVKVMRAAWPLHHYSNDASKAGIEQAVTGRAMPILIDEASDRADPHSARALVDLVLSASSDEGTQGTRGTSDGKGRRMDVAGLIVMASIAPPELEPQHLGRFTIMDLVAPEAGVDCRAEQDALRAYARENAAALWGRALASWDRYNEALTRFRGGLGKAGCAAREMDQLGALLAGWWILVREGLPDERGVREGIGALAGLVRLADEVQADDRPRRMVLHLLSTMVQLSRSTEREPIGKLIDIAFGQMGINRDPEAAREVLGHYGLRVVRATEDKDRAGRPVPRGGAGSGIWFARANPELRKLFAGTPFEGERWLFELRRLESARVSKGTIRICGIPTRAIWISRDELEAEQPSPEDEQNVQ